MRRTKAIRSRSRIGPIYRLYTWDQTGKCPRSVAEYLPLRHHTFPRGTLCISCVPLYMYAKVVGSLFLSCTALWHMQCKAFADFDFDSSRLGTQGSLATVFASLHYRNDLEGKHRIKRDGPDSLNMYRLGIPCSWCCGQNQMQQFLLLPHSPNMKDCSTCHP